MPQENPFYYNLPTSPEDFVGRWTLVDTIVHDVCRTRPDSWAIIGGRRFGKSSVLKVIESKLLERLAMWKPNERYVFPMRVDLKKCETKSECHIYACILHELHRALGALHKLPFPLPATRLSRWANTCQESIRFPNGENSFTNILEDLVQQFANCHILFRLVFLLDEVESVIEFAWPSTFFNQLRAMIYDGPLVNNVKLVLTGATKFIHLKQSGSPLLNAIKIEPLITLPDAAIDALIERGGSVSSEVKTMIRMQSGGHPFIAQYLLHHLWNGDLAHTTAMHVERIAYQMRQTRNDFQGWWESVGDSGQQAYAVLAAEEVWLTERLLLRAVQNITQSLDQGLSALCYHGLVVRDVQPWRYRIAGQLFYDWFMFNAQQQVSKFGYQTEVHKSELPPDIRVYIERIEQHIGTQTSVNGTINGAVLAALFQSAVAVGGGNAQNGRGKGESALVMARRVLNTLEEQAAGYTSLTIPASLKVQLEDKRQEVARLEAELKSA